MTDEDAEAQRPSENRADATRRSRGWNPGSWTPWSQALPESVFRSVGLEQGPRTQSQTWPAAGTSCGATLWISEEGQVARLLSPSAVLSTLPHCLPATPLYFSFSELCDLSVWGHERLITSVWTRRTVGRPCENFSHTLVPTGLGPELHAPVILSSCGPPWSQADPP